MKVKANTGEVHEVFKYIKDKEGQQHIWCNTWYGHHIIGQDCEWHVEAPPAQEAELWKEVYQIIEEDRKTMEPLIKLLIKLQSKYQLSLKSEQPEAVEFAEWAVKQGYRPSPVDNKYWCKLGVGSSDITAVELYQLFKQKK